MRTHFEMKSRGARRIVVWLLTVILVLMILAAAAEVASAQCVAIPTGETAVGLQNASSYYLLFFIDEERMDGVPAGDRSTYFIVTPGEHSLRAEAVIGGETVSATRTANIPEGNVCTWTVTDPKRAPGGEQQNFRDVVRREPKHVSAARVTRRQ